MGGYVYLLPMGAVVTSIFTITIKRLLRNPQKGLPYFIHGHKMQGRFCQYLAKSPKRPSPISFMDKKCKDSFVSIRIGRKFQATTKEQKLKNREKKKKREKKKESV